MTRKDRPPGRRLHGGPEDTRLLSGGPSVMVTDSAHDARAQRFGRPSTYSLPAAALAAHVRELRRAGWQGWEIRVRFTFDGCRNVA
jgi:hypothetical protein